MGELDYGTDPERVIAVARQVADVRDQGVEVAIVVGAGNIYRGMKGAAAGMDRATADYMGMLATVLNALPLQDALEKIGTDTRVQSALGDLRGRRALHPPPRDAPPREGAGRDLRGGHRQPVLHDRHAAALRAAEIHAEIILMAKNGVEGVYTADPAIDPTATFIPEITHMEAIERRLRVMDSTALALCMENGMPINVFNMDDDDQPGADNLRRARGHPRLDRRRRSAMAAENLIDELLKDAGERMDKSLESAQHEFSTVRTGRASPSLLDRIVVDYYGAMTPLNQISTISAPEARLLTRAALRQVFDQGDRESDQRVRRRPDALQRRQRRAAGGPRADRRAPPGAREGGQGPGRGGPCGDPQRPPRHDAAPARAEGRGRSRHPTTSTARRWSCRSSPTGASASSTAY